MSRTDAKVNFAWETGTPAPSVPADDFYVRWSGYIKPQYSQVYTFHVNHDDGARLWINNELVVNQWETTGEHSGSTGVAFQAGVLYPIRLEYWDNVSTATVKLYWQSSSRSKEIIPQARLYPSASGPTLLPTRSPTATLVSGTPTPFSGTGISSIVTEGKWDHYSIHFSHTVEYGPNRVLVLGLAHAHGASPHQMSFDGRLMTLAKSRCDGNDDKACTAMYYLVDPPVGTHAVRLSFSTGGKVLAGVMTLYGIDQANPLAATGSDYNCNSASTASVDLASEPGDFALDVISTFSCNSSSVTPGDGQTARWSQTMTNPDWTRRGGSSSKTATGSTVTMTRGASGTGCAWAYVAALFRAAQNAAPTPTMTASPSPTVTPTVASLPSSAVWRSYYFAGAQRVAVRVVGDPVPANNGVFYLLGDHLGSTNVIVDEDGTKLGEVRYKAWGETRHTSGHVPTDYRYTGQREEASFGLYYYRARWYDPALGRFAQADTLIPEPGNPLAWDRYAYVLNNPVRYTDPSGHYLCEDTSSCGEAFFPDKTPEKLTSEGQKFLNHFTRWSTALWKEHQLVLTLEMYVGMMTVIPEAGGDPAIMPLMTEAIARQIWVDARPYPACGHGPRCVGDSCVFGAFNYMAYSESAGRRLGLVKPSDDSLATNLLRGASETGWQILHPPDTWKRLDMNRPYNWGNDEDRYRTLVTRFGATIGTQPDQLWYSKPTNFILYSIAQSAYWASAAGKR